MEASGPINQLAHDVVTPAVRDLFEADGPFVTAYLGTPGGIENANRHSEASWRSLRQNLLAQGAPESVVAHIDPLIRNAHKQGATLAVVANASGVLHEAHLPDPPVHDVAWFAPLPAALPLVAWRQSQPGHVIALVDRTGADLLGFVPGGPDVVVDEIGDDDTWEVRLTSGGGWSQARYQRNVKEEWAHRADEVAGALTKLVDRIGARLVVVTGDEQAVHLLKSHLSNGTAGLIKEVNGGRSPDGGTEHIADEVVRLVANLVASDTVAILQKFKEERGQDDRAADGVAATLAALSAGQVETLLIAEDPDDARTAWFGPDPLPVALDAATLRNLGVVDPMEGRLQDVALRAAVGTSAGVWAVPTAGGPSDGLGALLRWA